MYLAIDIGGTKTLVAALDDGGVITERQRFPTPHDYKEWLKQLSQTVGSLNAKDFKACGVGVPGRIDRVNGVGLDMGNLPWHNVPVKKDVTKIVQCPVVVDNDANLAGLSEAMLLKGKFSHVLYITISTGIGTGIIINQKIEPAFADSEGGHMMLEHHGKLEEWEKFASGQAIYKRFGKQASEITDAETWKLICKDIAVGLIDLIAVIQPEVIVLGGGVGTYYERYKDYLQDALAPYETPLIPLPVIRQAGRPEDAVAYGCYDLAKSLYGNSGS